MAQDRKENPTLAAHVAEAGGAEREIESNLAAHLLLVTRSKHQARLERELEASKARVERLGERLKSLGGSVRGIPTSSKPAKNVKDAAKSAERRATKIAGGSAKKVRDAAELRRLLEAAREEQQEALKQSSAYVSLRALAKASDDKDTAKLAKKLRDEHREWASFLSDEIKSLSKKLVKAEGDEREKAASARRSSAAKRSASSRSGSQSSRRKGSSSSSNGRKRSTARKSSSTARKSGSTAKKSGSSAKKSGSSARKSSSTSRKSGSTARKSTSTARKRSSGTARKTSGTARKTSGTARKSSGSARRSSSSRKSPQRTAKRS